MIAPLLEVVGTAYPLGLKNCDTDIIISAEWLKTTVRAGLGRGAFAALRNQPDSVFNDNRYAGSPILIAGDNFGCGSSREHAAWAVADLGIKVIIAPSFSDIFSGNAFKNGILTVVLSEDVVEQLLESAKAGVISVDLDAQQVTTSSGDRFAFEVDPFRKRCLMAGLDEIELTFEASDKIASYEEKLRQVRSWQWSSALKAGDSIR